MVDSTLWSLETDELATGGFDGTYILNFVKIYLDVTVEYSTVTREFIFNN